MHRIPAATLPAVTLPATTTLIAILLLTAGCNIFTPPESSWYPDIPAFGEPPVQFSHPPGQYDPDALPELEISTTLENAVIYYTLDGSVPDPAHIMTDNQWKQASQTTRARTYRYSAPIQLSQHIKRPIDIARIPTNEMSNHRAWREPAFGIPISIPVRAIASTGHYSSREKIGTFSVHDHDLPVISLMTNRANLFDFTTGIYVAGEQANNPPLFGGNSEDGQHGNYSQSGHDWERPAYIELYENDPDNTRVLSQHIGIRIHGGYSRRLPQKSLRLYARSDYGINRLHYQFFPDKPVDTFNRLLLRQSGQDNNRSFLRDAVMHQLVEHLSLDTQSYRPAVMYINGEYWGLHNIRDRHDESYIATHYNLDPDQFTILNRNARLEHGNIDTRNTYYDMVASIGKSLDSAQKISRHMDLDQFYDYVALQWYAANTDWPHNNIRFWRSNQQLEPTGHLDGRWRWMVYDLDRSFGYVTNYQTDMVDWTMSMPDEFYRNWSRHLIHRLLDITEIRQAFFQRTAAHMALTYHPDRVRQYIDQAAARIETEIPNQHMRWGAPSLFTWNTQLNTMRIFANNRPQHLLAHIYEHFPDTSGTAELNLQGLPDDGSLTLETLPITQDQLTASMFTGIPVTLQGADLSTVDISGQFTLLERSSRKIRLIMRGDVTISG